MKLGSFSISFPVLKLNCTVQHAIPRQPTLFEKGILELVERFSAHDTYGKYTLDKVFAEILGVPEVNNFVKPSLDKLVALELVDCATNYTSLAEVTISQLTLTDDGAAMQAEGNLPGILSRNSVEYYYDVVRNSMMTVTEIAQLGDIAAEKRIDIDMDATFPEETLRETIIAEKPQWLTEGSDIRKIIRDDVALFWQEALGSINLTESGELGILFDEEFYENYFLSFNSLELYRDYLADLFQDNVTSMSPDHSNVNLGNTMARAEEMFLPRDLDLKIKLTPDTIHFLRYHAYLNDHLKCKPNTLLVVFEHLPEEIPEGIEWDGQINGAVIYLDERFIIDNCHYLNATRGNLFVDYFSVKINGEAHTIPLGYSLKSNDPQLDLGECYELLEEIINISDTLDHHLIKLFWKPVDEVLKDIENAISDQIDDPMRIVQKLTEYREKIQQLRPEM